MRVAGAGRQRDGQVDVAREQPAGSGGHLNGYLADDAVDLTVCNIVLPPQRSGTTVSPWQSIAPERSGATDVAAAPTLHSSRPHASPARFRSARRHCQTGLGRLAVMGRRIARMI